MMTGLLFMLINASYNYNLTNGNMNIIIVTIYGTNKFTNIDMVHNFQTFFYV